jgi:AcrR family transcriptional regulator
MATQSHPRKHRQRNPAQTRLKLLQATIQLLAEKGVDALSVKEVARIAGVSRAVAYQHFDDREHLLQEAKRWMSHSLESIAQSDSSSLEERVHHVSRLVLGNREASRLLIAGALGGQDLSSDHPLYQQVMQLLQEFTVSGNARKDIDIEIMYFIMIGVIASLIMVGARHKRDDIDELADRFTVEWTRVLRHGIFLPGKARSAHAARRRGPARPTINRRRVPSPR